MPVFSAETALVFSVSSFLFFLDLLSATLNVFRNQIKLLYDTDFIKASFWFLISLCISLSASVRAFELDLGKTLNSILLTASIKSKSFSLSRIFLIFSASPFEYLYITSASGVTYSAQTSKVLNKTFRKLLSRLIIFPIRGVFKRSSKVFALYMETDSSIHFSGQGKLSAFFKRLSIISITVSSLLFLP